MNKEETIKKLAELKKYGDTEIAHIEADEALCKFLESLGYKDVVKLYKSIVKWYS